MLRNVTAGQLACIGEIARRIYNQIFPMLTRLLNYFKDRSLVLRSLFTDPVFPHKINNPGSLSQDDTQTSPDVLPPSHHTRSNTFPARILRRFDSGGGGEGGRRRGRRWEKDKEKEEEKVGGEGGGEDIRKNTYDSLYLIMFAKCLLVTFAGLTLTKTISFIVI